MTLGAPILGALALIAALAFGLWIRRRGERAPIPLLIGAALAALAVGGPRLSLSDGPRLRIVLLDASGSFARAFEPLREPLMRAGEDLDEDDRLALMLFADGPETAIPPIPPSRFPAAIAAIEPTRELRGSAIADAIAAALTLDSGERRRELLLISDGLEDRGDLRLAALEAAAQGVPIHAYCPPLAPARDAAILRLVAPEKSAPGLAVEVELQLRSSVDCMAELIVEARREGSDLSVWKRRLDLSLPQGATLPRSVSEVFLEPGNYKIEARLRTDIARELWAQNNRAEAWVQVGEKGLAWVVSRRPRLGLDLVRRAGFRAQALSPGKLAEAIKAPRSLQLILLDDVPARFLSPVSGELEALVRKGGVGLCVLGGRASFGPGGYAGAPFEDLLPLRSAPPGDEARALALALAVDASGSMNEEYPRALSAGIEPRLGLLRPGDQVSLAAFAEGSRYRRPLGPGPLSDDLKRLKALEPEGGTDLARALGQDILGALAGAPPGAARIGVLVTDGQAQVGAEALRSLKAQAEALAGEPPARIILVHIGGDKPGFQALEALARHIENPRCQAKALPLSQAGEELGELLEDEAAQGREEIRLGSFLARIPKAGRRGLVAPSARLGGYLRTRLADGAERLASAGPEDEPLVALLTGGWTCLAFAGSLDDWSSKAWKGSPEGQDFLAALPGLARPRLRSGPRLDARRQGRRLLLELELGEDRLGAASAQLLDRAGAELGVPIVLAPVAPGLFRAQAPAPEGAARVRFALDEEVLLPLLSLPSPGAAELQRSDPDLEALRALASASGGRWLAGLPRSSAPLTGGGGAAPRSLSPILAAAALLALFASAMGGPGWPRKNGRASRS